MREREIRWTRSVVERPCDAPDIRGPLFSFSFCVSFTRLTSNCCTMSSHGEGCGHSHSHAVLREKSSLSNYHDVRVTHIAFDSLVVDFAASRLVGKVSYTVKVLCDEGASEVVLDTKDLVIKEVSCDGAYGRKNARALAHASLLKVVSSLPPAVLPTRPPMKKRS